MVFTLPRALDEEGQEQEEEEEQEEKEKEEEEEAEEEQGQKGRKEGERKGGTEGRGGSEMTEGRRRRSSICYTSAAHVRALEHTRRVWPHMLPMVSLCYS